MCPLPSPPPRFSCYFLSQGPFFGGGPLPERCCHWQSTVAKGGRVVSEGTRLPASSLFLLIRASTQVLQFTLRNPYYRRTWGCVPYIPAFRIVSVLTAQVGSEDLIDNMVLRQKWGHTKTPMTPLPSGVRTPPSLQQGALLVTDIC